MSGITVGIRVYDRCRDLPEWHFWPEVLIESAKPFQQNLCHASLPFLQIYIHYSLRKAPRLTQILFGNLIASSINAWASARPCLLYISYSVRLRPGLFKIQHHLQTSPGLWLYDRRIIAAAAMQFFGFVRFLCDG